MSQINQTFSSNMSAEATRKQYDDAQPKSQQPENKNQVVFDERRYLQTRLEDGEKEKKMKIRLLPITPDATTPFMQVYIHMLRVSKEVAPSGWKRIICPVKNGFETEMEQCPFCTIANDSFDAMKKLSKESQEYKDLKQVAMGNKARVMWLCRCIDRDHEDEGVKWWMFPHQESDHDGVLDKLNAIEKTYQDINGKDYTIYSLNNGLDLNLNISKTNTNGKERMVINIIANPVQTPLTSDYEKGMLWINDQVKWTDMYKTKPYEYMSILASGGVPVYDKDSHQFVDKNAGVTEAYQPQQQTAEEARQDMREAINTPSTSSDQSLQEQVDKLPF